MPLPLPNLDTRQWADLVEEGRALIPRYAPSWTNHNIHDPGITLIELFAWLVEQDIYRLNRVSARSRRKFLALIGFAPAPPRAAETVLAFTLRPGEPGVTLPPDTLLDTTDVRGRTLTFRTLAELTALPATLTTIQVDDGSGARDRTRPWSERRPVPVFGLDAGAPARIHVAAPGETVADIARRYEVSAEALVALNRLPGVDIAPLAGQRLAVPPATALYLGFDQPLPSDVPVSLWLRFQGPGADRDERARLARELKERTAACRPLVPARDCDPGPPVAAPPTSDAAAGAELAHHAARTVWEYYAEDGGGGRWRLLDPATGQVADDTRALTLDGRVRITLPAPTKARALGDRTTEAHYLRCRLDGGQYDAAPVLLDAVLNAVAAEQAAPVGQTFAIAPGVTPAGPAPAPGALTRLQLSLDAGGVVQSLTFAPDAAALPWVRLLDYQPPAPDAAGSLALDVVLLGVGDGRSLQRAALPSAPVQDGVLSVWTLEGEDWRAWGTRPDLDAARRTDRHAALDATVGALTFGDGERGRMPPRGAPLLAAYRATAGAAGSRLAGAPWLLADNPHNRALMHDFAARRDALGAIVNPFAAAGGADAESLEHAAGRAAETLWAHERLVELCSRADCATLDQLDAADVRNRQPPGRAATLLDFERLALGVPGARIARARARAGIDPAYPDLAAPGTVTLIIVPYLPRGRPEPAPGLLAAVRRYLDRRRVIGTRLVVVGPRYLEVSVRATVRAQAGARAERVRDDVTAALTAFLDPLQGGPAGRGWPFGRDVYRSEVFEVIDDVPGVDSVLDLELVVGAGAGQCGNVCVGPTALVRSGQHAIAVV